MFTKIIEASGDATIRKVPKEGELYKVGYRSADRKKYFN